MHYPLIEVECEDAKPPTADGPFTHVRRVTVDGVDWPVTSIAFEMSNERRGVVAVIKVRANLRWNQGKES